MTRMRRARTAPVLAALVAAAVACGATPAEHGSGGDLPPFSTSSPDAGNKRRPDGGVIQTASRSCTGGPGADGACGGGADARDCCEARLVPGGSYDRFDDPGFPATVSPFVLDTFEVTAGRIRAWVEATDGDLRGSAPAAGAGAHPKIKGSGWRPEWNRYLPSSRAEVDRLFGPEDGREGILACQIGTNVDDYGALTWWTPELDEKVRDRNQGRPEILSENTKDALDRKPINCIPWHVLFAFCVWDGGRLPTDAEFGFAFAGGSEQRPFPWGRVAEEHLAHIGDRPDLSLVPTYEHGRTYVTARLYDATRGPNVFEDNYSFTYGGTTMARSDNAAHIAPVGNTPLGDGKWGHADLAGGVFEWMLDAGPIRPGACDDCANVSWPGVDEIDPSAFMEQPEFRSRGGVDWWRGGARAVRGSAWDNAIGLAAKQSRDEIEYHTSYPVLRTYRSLGGRCARDL